MRMDAVVTTRSSERKTIPVFVDPCGPVVPVTAGVSERTVAESADTCWCLRGNDR